ncbi:hypothetical protein ABIE65_004800 [Constrictibacter sp. MBR-5]|jgi:hypothetical protein|uniref:alginate export family protein n=1 Tax=Constrictibacter sp. MBR-5 TaxID=3156467 RepID=UPI00339AD889
MPDASPGPTPLRLLASAMLLASVASAALAETARPDFAPLRQDEDWSALCDPAARTRWYDALKCIPLSGDGVAWLSLGGEVRERYEYTRDPAWGDDLQDRDGVFLQRYVLHGDLHLGPHLRLFGQIYSALEDGRAGPPGPVDENRLDVQQAFVDLSAPAGTGGDVTLRLGRQELRYGSARLVDVREGPNVRRKFDGGRARLSFDDWRVDALAVRPARIDPGRFDDGIDHDQALWGVYAVDTQPGWLPAGTSLDLYYLGYANDAGSFAQGTARERRHTVGTRLWGAQSGWDWNWEFIYQFGSFGSGDIAAWSVASDTGHTWRDLPWTPRFGLSANVASGDDDPDDSDLGTFNPLFPRGNYFSELALLGPRNFFNLHPGVTVEPADGLSLTLDVDFYWRLQRDDGIYGPGGGLLRAGTGSDARHVGTELSFNATWQIAADLSATAIYAHFIPGAFIRQTGRSESVDFVELTLRAQF